jgi:hypothetical protein
MRKQGVVLPLMKLRQWIPHLLLPTVHSSCMHMSTRYLHLPAKGGSMAAAYMHQLPHKIILSAFMALPAQDPFGAGMRISTRYAYLGGKVCAWLQIPEPTSGTIFGMYLIDIHPKGELGTGSSD